MVQGTYKEAGLAVHTSDCRIESTKVMGCRQSKKKIHVLLIYLYYLPFPEVLKKLIIKCTAKIKRKAI